MSNEDNINRERLLNAQKKVRKLKVFYIHLIGYFILVILLLYNIYILEGEYKDFFLWFNLTFIVSWTIFIAFHAWSVFRGRVLFSKRWEERKVKEFLNEEIEEEEVQIWE